MTSSFWGLRLEPGKRYSTTVDKAFHVSMAALDATSVKNDKDVHSVMLEEGESSTPFILCNLSKPVLLQSHLDLNFETGDRITFFCKGSGTIHLTGYIMQEDDGFGSFGEEGEEEEEGDEDVEEEEDDDEEEEDDVKVSKGKLNGVPAKRKVQGQTGLPAKKKKAEVNEGESEDDSDDDLDEDDELEGDSAGSDELDQEAESDEDNNEEEMEVEEKQPKIQKKKNKGGQNQQSLGEQGKNKKQMVNGAPQQQQSQQQNKKEKQPQKEQETNEKSGADGQKKRTLEGGVIIHDIKVGNGPLCKPGRMASVYYIGRLKSNNKVFDQTSQGPGMKFRVGRGEVIKGWDVGLAGMKVGGKRLITCPPNMAYGQKGMQPTIPPNSTLVFEVELKGVN